MIIALDYDGTYTRCPEIWNRFIADAVTAGHEVICATMRHASEHVNTIPCRVIYTSRRAKCQYLMSIGIEVDIWIDNDPLYIFNDA